jgi:uncharacterized ferritin-like protein (DUF455 family)
MDSLFELARTCIAALEPAEKLALSAETAERWQAGLCTLGSTQAVEPIPVPGRPERPVLVHPSRVAQRKLASPEGRAAFLHALAHIEFNAINLAWDAVYRFRGLPRDFYTDWVQVAAEEAQHFGLLSERLEGLGYGYGDFPAHDGLWDMACRTAHDPLVRMALVPRVLEARGLDVTPAMIRRLQQAGDSASAGILDKILADEIGHVAKGSRWYRYLCRQRKLDPVATFHSLLEEYRPGRIRKPLNTMARSQAGSASDEMKMLQALAEGQG